MAVLVALDRARREQTRQRDAQAVLGDCEQAAGRDEAAHGHGAARQRREQVEDQALSGSVPRRDITETDLGLQYL